MTEHFYNIVSYLCWVFPFLNPSHTTFSNTSPLSMLAPTPRFFLQLLENTVSVQNSPIHKGDNISFPWYDLLTKSLPDWRTMAIHSNHFYWPHLNAEFTESRLPLLQHCLMKKKKKKSSELWTIYGRQVGNKWSLSSLPMQTILWSWFYELETGRSLRQHILTTPKSLLPSCYPFQHLQTATKTLSSFIKELGREGEGNVSCLGAIIFLI